MHTNQSTQAGERNATSVQFATAQNFGINLKRGKQAFPMNVEIKESEVTYTCPQCGARQTHLFFGREYHACNSCATATEIKG